jgi:hypothetical protein
LREPFILLNSKLLRRKSFRFRSGPAQAKKSGASGVLAAENRGFHHPNCQCGLRRRTLPPLRAPDIVAANRLRAGSSMIRKSGQRFPDKIMLKPRT